MVTRRMTVLLAARVLDVCILAIGFCFLLPGCAGNFSRTVNVAPAKFQELALNAEVAETMVETHYLGVRDGKAQLSVWRMSLWNQHRSTTTLYLTDAATLSSEVLNKLEAARSRTQTTAPPQTPQ